MLFNGFPHVLSGCSPSSPPFSCPGNQVSSSHTGHFPGLLSPMAEVVFSSGSPRDPPSGRGSLLSPGKSFLQLQAGAESGKDLPFQVCKGKAPGDFPCQGREGVTAERAFVSLGMKLPVALWVRCSAAACVSEGVVG